MVVMVVINDFVVLFWWQISVVEYSGFISMGLVCVPLSLIRLVDYFFRLAHHLIYKLSS